jgi:2-keto-4-pentenoate hydratase
LVELGRKGSFVTTGITAGVVPVARGDQVRVTYTVLPTATFFKG